MPDDPSPMAYFEMYGNSAGEEIIETVQVFYWKTFLILNALKLKIIRF